MSASKKALSANRGSGVRPNLVEGCPLTAALPAIGGKWKMGKIEIEPLKRAHAGE